MVYIVHSTGFVSYIGRSGRRRCLDESRGIGLWDACMLHVACGFMCSAVKTQIDRNVGFAMICTWRCVAEMWVTKC